MEISNIDSDTDSDINFESSQNSSQNSTQKSTQTFTFPKVVLKFHPDEYIFPKNNGSIINCTSCVGTLIYKNITYNSIEYIFDYEESGATGCFYCCCPSSECLGYHLGDRERIILLMSDDYKEIIWVYFNAHDMGEGMWVAWDDCLKTSDNKLIAYIARGGHAFYPYPRTYIRFLGFANDMCAEHGDTFEINVVGTHTDRAIPRQHSITPCERFFIPFLEKKLANGP
jgi:hypothetical protein